MPFDAETPEGCSHCLDEDGEPQFPWYGHAPWVSTCFLNIDGGCMSVHLNDGTTGDFNPLLFRPDPEDESRGTYIRCPKCWTPYEPGEDDGQ